MAHDLFRPVGSFLGVPQRPDPAGARAAIMGLPFDAGLHPRRTGARLGPAAIRMMSTDMVRHHRPEDAEAHDPVAALGLVDLGDVAVVQGDHDAALARMEAAYAAVIEAGAVPVGLGGDGMVSVPAMAALGAAYPGLAVIHLDSHTDAYPPKPGVNAPPLDPATTFAHAAERGLVAPERSVHAGLRGFAYVPGVFEHAETLGYRLIPMSVIEVEGIPATAARIRRIVGEAPVFLCVDMDVFDPATAPGVFTPAWGGLTAREGLGLLRALTGLDIVGADINTVTPGFDMQGQTAWLAATVALEILYLIAEAPHRHAPRPVSRSVPGAVPRPQP
ncbi:MAG: arginase family protein [Pseudomonadota bacterium]